METETTTAEETQVETQAAAEEAVQEPKAQAAKAADRKAQAKPKASRKANPRSEKAKPAAKPKAQPAANRQAKQAVQLFAQTIVLRQDKEGEKALRVMTSGGECKFFNPLEGTVRHNDIPSQWAQIPGGSRVHLVAWCETPDAAVVLLETDTESGPCFVGTVLRRSSWEKVLKAEAE